MNGYKIAWIMAYDCARVNGKSEEVAIKYAEAKAQEWTERQIASAEARLEDR